MFVEVVNMIPHSLSGESNMDSEPNITVNPANPRHMAASAFTPDPLLSGHAPIYVSTDGGQTWALNVVMPGGNVTNDITVRFASKSNMLYAGILRGGTLDLNILRKANFIAPGLMTVLVNKTNDDQPYIQAHSHAGTDHVYVGDNDFNSSPKTATVDLSQDAATPPPPAGFVFDHVEPRGTMGQDGPPIRPAIHPNGTIYAAYCGWRGTGGPGVFISDIVVARDDHWASGAIKFGDLKDPVDLLPGIRVVSGISIPFFPGAFLGNQRSAASGLAIAVDPRDSAIVYLAWAEGTNAANYTLHLRRSTDKGHTWSGDLRAIVQAMNPTLAINDRGEVGFFYQKFHNPGTGNRWQNHIEISHDGFATRKDIILADLPDINGPGPTLNPNNPIGDYAGLVTVGRTFYGIFSGNNTPDLANFPNGVKYQRNANFATKQLLDLGGFPVPESYDPFFYRIFWEEKEEHGEREEGHGVECGRLEVKGLKWEKIEIKELRLDLKDPRRRGRHEEHSHHEEHHHHKHESHERGGLVRRLGEELEELGRRIADSAQDDDDHS
ncbi:MAG TPA: sialidase family protein [Candidatus Angelobacter sp.]